MTLKEMSMWKRGDLREYEKTLNKVSSLNKKKKRVLSKIYDLEDAIQVFRDSNDFGERYKSKCDELNKQREELDKINIDLIVNEEKLKREFY